MKREREVKENTSQQELLSVWWVVGLSALSLGAFLVVYWLDGDLPAPRDPATAKPTDFIAQNAYDMLLNLTSIGPRVAGSYENEVLGAGAVAGAVRWAKQHASPHNTVQMQVHTASGAFALTFFDGMTNVYRSVQSVVARVAGAGARPGRRPALLLNCHFDTVPGSPGASDDGAGCAVLAETLRALAATPRPLRHDAVFLFNGAEENIMQASHAFVTTHPWAKSVRAFINIEACGAGGREVLFQAGPYDPWIMETYGAVVPRPFASSLAQEMFESGLIPADTDFRVFRDFGNLSGVDLAWASNGYVYHTYLDTAERVPLGSLQRTGDNVLALAHGLVSSERLEQAVERSRQPVFFDVVGAVLVTARPPLAAAVALAAAALAACRLLDSARDARKQLYVSNWALLVATWRVGVALAVASVAGVVSAAALGLVMHVSGARLSFYSRPVLLAPLYAIPAICVTWWVGARLVSRVRLGGAVIPGWWRARLAMDAMTAGWALLVLLALARGMRSGFVPLQWALMLGVAERAGRLAGARSGAARTVCWALGAALPALQTWYLALNSLAMFVPLAGRSGTAAVPPDVSLALLGAVLSVAATAWLLPVVLIARDVNKLLAVTAAACLLTGIAVATTSLGAAYSAARPQRFMVFHTRRTVHDGATLKHEDLYWLPHLDPNTPESLLHHVPEVGSSQPSTAAECARWPYCGAPYFLPVLALVARGYSLPAPPPPAPAAAATALSAAAAALHDTRTDIALNITGPSHVVLIVAPAAGARLVSCSVLNDGTSVTPARGLRWGDRDTHFISLTDTRASPNRPWHLKLHLEHRSGLSPKHWATLSVAGHAMAAQPGNELQALLNRFPSWTAPVGWQVHLHLLNV